MPGKRKLFWQLYPSYLLISLISLVAVTWYASTSIRRFHIDQAAADLEARARIFEQQIAAYMNPLNTGAIDRLAKEAGRAAFTRITVMLPSGRVVGDSYKDPALMDNHADRPEFTGAIRGGRGVSLRHSATLDKDLMYVAIPLKREDHAVAVVRTSIPIDSIISFADYKYSSYRIRKWRWKNNRQIDKEMPSRRLKEDILKFVCELTERKNVKWYTFLKDVRKDYGLEPETENYPEPEELEEELKIEIYGNDGLSKWLLASIYLALGKEVNEIKQVLEKKKEILKKIEEKTGFKSLEELYKKVKDGKEFEKKVKEIIEKVVGKEEGKVEDAFKIFIKGLLTEVYIGREKKSQNKLQKRMKDYIEGITWDGKEKRAWTFTLFAESKDDLSEIENKLKNGVIWDREKKRLSFNEEIKGSFGENVIAFLFFDDTKEENEKKKEIEKIRERKKVLEDNLKDKREILIIEKIVDWEPVR